MEQRRMDYHLHSTFSIDGRQTLDELCTAMEERGVQEICLTEHIDYGHPTDDLPPVFPDWLKALEEMRAKHPTLVIRQGLEIGDKVEERAKIMDTLNSVPLDFRLLSFHLVNGVDCYNPEYYAGKTRDQAYHEYIELKAKSILAWTDFDSIAHIGYVAKFAPYEGAERPLVYADAPDEFDALLRHVIGLDKCIEVNTSGFASTGNPFPHASVIRRYIELGGENFTFGSDSHDTVRDYADIERAKDLVRSLGGRYQVSFEQRKPKFYKI